MSGYFRPDNWIPRRSDDLRQLAAKPAVVRPSWHQDTENVRLPEGKELHHWSKIVDPSISVAAFSREVCSAIIFACFNPDDVGRQLRRYRPNAMAACIPYYYIYHSSAELQWKRLLL